MVSPHKALDCVPVCVGHNAWTLFFVEKEVFQGQKSHLALNALVTFVQSVRVLGMLKWQRKGIIFIVFSTKRVILEVS